MHTAGCRRLVLADYLDETERLDCVAGEIARCDRSGSGVTDWHRGQKRVAEEKREVLDALDQIANGYPVC